MQKEEIMRILQKTSGKTHLSGYWNLLQLPLKSQMSLSIRERGEKKEREGKKEHDFIMSKRKIWVE